MRKTFACAQCGKSFERKHAPSQPLPKFCTRACASARKAEEMRTDHSRWETPAQATAARRNLEKSRESPAMAAYLASDRNPFRAQDPEIRARAIAANRAAGFRGLTGGNGALTTPQELLLKLLGSEFTPEFSISLGLRQPGYPTHYKVDLGCPRLKLAVELDGHSHRSKSRQALDRKKDEKLSSLGWTILRVRNETALSDTSGTLLRIRETMSRMDS
jgi:hypothetical protein